MDKYNAPAVIPRIDTVPVEDIAEQVHVWVVVGRPVDIAAVGANEPAIHNHISP